MKARLHSLAVAVLLIIPLVFCAMSEASSPQVNVGLEKKVSSATIGSTSGGLIVKKKMSDKQIGAFKSVSITAKGAKIFVNGKSTGSSRVYIISKGGFVRYDRHSYRGVIIAIAYGNTVTIVNQLLIEEYLWGVLKMEANPEWPSDALKAQAIVARTFAYRQKGKHGGEGFDLCDQVDCQVYRGVNAEDPRTTKAVKDTEGVILFYKGSPAMTFYHSDSGGATANASDVWGDSVPYLKVVKEQVAYESPNSRWTYSINLSNLESKLRSAGINVNGLKGIRINGRDEAGRVTRVDLVESGGRSVSISSSRLRMAVGPQQIKSTFFELGVGSEPVVEELPPVEAPPGSLSEMVQKNVFTKDELMDMLLHPEKKQEYYLLGQSRGGKQVSSDDKGNFKTGANVTLTKLLATAPVIQGVNGVVMFTGRGWGHGVGMSQWGAKAMAGNGFNFKDILLHYFPGTVFKKAW